MESKDQKSNRLAREVLLLSRNTLLVNLRFLDMALSRLEYKQCEEPAILTDGEILLYNPLYILSRYSTEKEILVRDYLHIILHCVFHHMFMDPTLNRPIWDFACDIAVENTITELGLRAASASRERLQGDFCNLLKTKLNSLTAERIYRLLLDKNMTPEEIDNLRTLFYADDHKIWYMTNDLVASQYGIRRSVDNGDASESASRLQVWKDISERMQQELETFAKQQGNSAGGLMVNLVAVNRERYDYTAFLKKFAVTTEVMKLDMDSFDYVFYTYGLRLYKNLPLIEPLEYKETKRIKDFVIAIDTSGSVAGELVQCFVQKTYNILKSTESFFSKINLYIIQCDADTQETVKITSQKEFDDYLLNMKLYGFGGTDFRPVFDYVDNLRKQGELRNLKGLLYFTDGYGTFPARAPNYKAAFVFLDEDDIIPEIPPWAIKLILRKEDLNSF